MSTISPQESQYYKELVTPFQPNGRTLVGTDLRGTQCDRFGRGELRLVGYGDSSGGYAFSPKNQDAAIAPSFNSANLSNIANSLPRITEVQDFAGKWIDSITLHALDEFIEQTEPQSFIGNTLRIFSGGQKDFRGDGTGNRNIRNTYTLVAEIPIPALTRADVPRSFNVKVCAYIPPAQNIYLGLALPQPYTCSFEIWDLQANTQIGSGFSSSIGGSSSVGEGNDLSEEIADTPADTRFVLPIQFASATWIRGITGEGVNPPPPSTTPPSTGNPPPTSSVSTTSTKPSEDKDESQPSASSPSSPSSPSSSPKQSNPPASAGCVPPQDCNWYSVTSAQSAMVDMNLNGGTSLCPKGTLARGIVDFESSGSFVLCCGAATYPPNNLGCSSLTKWSCVSGGNCVQDALGTYNSQAECEAALIQPNFTGGQCTGTLYTYLITATCAATQNGLPITVTSQSQIGGNGRFLSFSISGLAPTPNGVKAVVTATTSYGNLLAEIFFLGGSDLPPVIYNLSTVPQITNIQKTSGTPDNCGNPPPTCP